MFPGQGSYQPLLPETKTGRCEPGHGLCICQASGNACGIWGALRGAFAPRAESRRRFVGSPRIGRSATGWSSARALSSRAVGTLQAKAGKGLATDLPTSERKPWTPRRHLLRTEPCHINRHSPPRAKNAKILELRLQASFTRHRVSQSSGSASVAWPAQSLQFPTAELPSCFVRLMSCGLGPQCTM